VYRNGELSQQTQGLSWWQEGLAPGTEYIYAVYALDNDGNRSASSNTLTLTTSGAGGTSSSSGGDTSSGSSSSGAGGSNSPPSSPQQLSGQAHSSTAIEISWNPSTDSDGNVDKYEIYRNGEFGHRTQGQSWWQEGLTPATTYSYQVYAIDNDGGRSAASNTLTVTTQGGGGGQDTDNGLPTSPVVSGQAYSQTAIEIQWTASTDSNGSVEKYGVYRDGEFSHYTLGRSWWQEGLTRNTEYRYEVVALDNEGNHSAPSSPIVVRTNP